MSEMQEFYSKLSSDTEKMKKEIPSATAGFGALFNRVMTDGALTLREKELVALGIAVFANCKPCIAAHTKKCLEAGATREQILEAAAVAVVMGGGPAYMHLPVVIEALDALTKK